MAEATGFAREKGVDLGETHGPVVLRLARAEKVEVRSVQNQDRRHRKPLAAGMNPVNHAEKQRFRGR